MVIEAVGFASAGFASAGQQDSFGDAGCRWLAELAGGAVHEDVVGAGSDGPVLGWIGPRPFTEAEAGRLREVARFAAAPLAALSARATLTAALEAYLGRRSAARVLAGPLRRDVGETIRAALLYADLRSFTALSEAAPPASAPRYSCRPRNGQRADAILGRLEPPAEGIRPAASGLTAVGSRVVRNQSRAGSNPSADEIRHDAAKVSGGVTPFRGSGRPGFTRPISCRTDQGEGGCSTGIYRHTVSQQRGDQTCRHHLRTAGSGSP